MVSAWHKPQTYTSLNITLKSPWYDKKGSITLINEIETYNLAEHEIYCAYKC